VARTLVDRVDLSRRDERTTLLAEGLRAGLRTTGPEAGCCDRRFRRPTAVRCRQPEGSRRSRGCSPGSRPCLDVSQSTTCRRAALWRTALQSAVRRRSARGDDATGSAPPNGTERSPQRLGADRPGLAPANDLRRVLASNCRANRAYRRTSAIPVRHLSTLTPARRGTPGMERARPELSALDLSRVSLRSTVPAVRCQARSCSWGRPRVARAAPAAGTCLAPYCEEPEPHHAALSPPSARSGTPCASARRRRSR